MSEDCGFTDKNKPQINADERRCGVDLCGSLGKGMLAKEKIETLGNSSGLIPLSFGVNDNNRITDRENKEIIRTEMNSGSVSSYGVSTSSLLNCSNQCAQNTGMPGNSSGLSPFRPSGEIYSIKKKSLSMVEGFSANKGLETLGNASGLTPLNYDTEPPIDTDKCRDSPHKPRMQNPIIINFVSKGE